MQACMGISTCAVLTPSLRDFCPKHKGCMYVARYIAAHHIALAFGCASACGDMPACTM